MFKKISNLFSKKSNDADVVEKVEPKTNPSGSMTLQDFMNQMNMMSKMGSLSKVMKYIS